VNETPAEPFPGPLTELPLQRVDVWIVSLGETGLSPDPADWLSADERARAARFTFERDRRRYSLGRGALRGILATYLRCDRDEIVFAYGETGKPRLAGADAASGLQFNASGSADMAVCAVTYGRRVGIDIEQMRVDCDPDLVQYALTDGERAEFRRIPLDQQATTFYRVWTRKEAFLKATGCGLSRPLTSFAVSVAPDKPPRLVHDEWASESRTDERTPRSSNSERVTWSTYDEQATWSFADFDPAAGLVGTLVHSGEPRPVRTLEWHG
jgi:4'-phosphopantetheinyl transferase